MTQPIPVTLLTGFLGAGKTTLLNHLIAATSGERVFVIENEFGPVSVDADLLICDRADVIEMTGGCLCCSIRGDLSRHLIDILARRDSGELRFDRLIIETTGLADPTPVAQTFFAEEQVAAGYLLDAVLVVVDAVHADAQLDQHPVAQRQVGFADRVLISKSDLVDSTELEALSDRLSAMNPGARQLIVDQGVIDSQDVLDIRGFNLHERALASLDGEASKYRRAGTVGYGLGRARHDDEVRAVLLEHPGPMDMDRVSAFMQRLLDELGDQLLRYKGILSISGESRRLILQGVHRLAGFDYGSPWREGEAEISRIVLIGRRLPEDRLTADFAESAAIPVIL